MNGHEHRKTIRKLNSKASDMVPNANTWKCGEPVLRAHLTYREDLSLQIKRGIKAAKERLKKQQQ